METKSRLNRPFAGRVPVAAALALGGAAAPCALAYLDPNSGSMMLQLLLGGAAGAAVALRLFWHRLTALLPGRRGAKPRSED